MAVEIKRGLEKILMGDIAGDGGMGTVLTEVGYTELGSVTFNETDATTQDFFIEEQDERIDSEVTQAGSKSITWGTNNVEPAQIAKVKGGTVGSATAGGAVATLGTITGGSGYTNGVHPAIPLFGGTGSGVIGTVTVSGGAVTAIAITAAGTGHTAGDVITGTHEDLGEGTGFQVVIATVTTASGASWSAPDTEPTIYKSLQLHWKNGGYVNLPRVKITAKTDFSFTKTALSKLTITAEILKPTKSGTPTMQVFPAG